MTEEKQLNCWDHKTAKSIDTNTFKNKKPLEPKTTGLILNLIKSRFLKKKKIRLIDYGCGVGRFYGILKKYELLDHIDYIGVDTSIDMLKFAKKRFPEAHFQLISGASKPTERALEIAEKFGIELATPKKSDILICLDVLQHIDTPKQFILDKFKDSETLVFEFWTKENGDKFGDKNIARYYPSDQWFIQNTYDYDEVDKFVKDQSLEEITIKDGIYKRTLIFNEVPF